MFNSLIKLITLLIFSATSLTFAQPNIRGAVHYSQVSSFETDYYINALKMSSDGSKIVFSTGGPEVKIFTIDTDGTDLTQVYDLQRTGTAPMVDISPDGEKVLWCDFWSAIFVANSDGTNVLELASLMPHPDPNFADMVPEINLPPRFTSDGNTIFFMHSHRDARGAGVWSVNTDNSGLQQIFNYVDVSTQIYGLDGSEYNRNTMFTDGFDINGDGSKIIFGIKGFKLQEGDLSRGEAIVAVGNTFYKLCDYVLGNQPFATNLDDDLYLVFKLEYNDSLQYEVINVYFEALGTGDPV
jgi:hypothetical protein